MRRCPLWRNAPPCSPAPTVFDNIRKVISWTIPTNGGEALTIIIALLVDPHGANALDARIEIDLAWVGEPGPNPGSGLMSIAAMHGKSTISSDTALSACRIAPRSAGRRSR